MKDELITYGGSALTWLTTVFQTEATFKMIQIILAILASAVTIAFSIYKWVKKAKADGKIDKDEIKEGIEIIADGAKDIADKINDIKEIKEDGDRD